MRPSDLVLGLGDDLERLERAAMRRRERAASEVEDLAEARNEAGRLREQLEQARSEVRQVEALRKEAGERQKQLDRATSEIERLRSVHDEAATWKTRAGRAEEAVRLLQRERGKMRRTLREIAAIDGSGDAAGSGEGA